eukprot:7171358-Prymnesium_polylepis.2
MSPPPSKPTPRCSAFASGRPTCTTSSSSTSPPPSAATAACASSSCRTTRLAPRASRRSVTRSPATPAWRSYGSAGRVCPRASGSGCELPPPSIPKGRPSTSPTASSLEPAGWGRGDSSLDRAVPSLRSTRWRARETKEMMQSGWGRGAGGCEGRTGGSQFEH